MGQYNQRKCRYLVTSASKALRHVEAICSYFNDQRQNADPRLSSRNPTNLGGKFFALRYRKAYEQVFNCTIYFTRDAQWTTKGLLASSAELRAYRYDFRRRGLEAQCGRRKLWIKDEADQDSTASNRSGEIPINKTKMTRSYPTSSR